MGKKQKLNDEERIFNNEWFMKYFVVQQNAKIVYLICQNNKACLKEYNIKGHNNSIHSKKYDKISGQLRVDKANKLREITTRSTKNNFDS